MRYEYYQPNPVSPNEDDCVIRAICKATGKDWDMVYTELCTEGMSTARGRTAPRDSMGRYTSRDGESEEELLDKLMAIRGRR